MTQISDEKLSDGKLYLLTLSRCSFPLEVRVQMRKCLVNRKHCRSPSFLRDSEPRRTLLSFPFSTDGSWTRDPAKKNSDRFHQINNFFFKSMNERINKQIQVTSSNEFHVYYLLNQIVRMAKNEIYLTLPYKRLTGVEQNVTTFHDHPLDGQILTDVFRVAHLIVHHPENKQ